MLTWGTHYQPPSGERVNLLLFRFSFIMTKALSETMEPDNCQDANLPQTKLVIVLYIGFIELTNSPRSRTTKHD